jgi:hypothetical protein
LLHGRVVITAWVVGRERERRNEGERGGRWGKGEREREEERGG